MEIIAGPRLAEEGVFFKLSEQGQQRECLVSKNALAYICRLHGQSMDFMGAYRDREAQIHAIAQRLVQAGEKANPLVLGAAYFVGAKPAH
jgi:hypothetical protein